MSALAPGSDVLRAEFPQLADSDLLYFDNAATSLKPRAVIEAITSHLSTRVSNVHRGSYGLSVEATERYEGAREEIARAIGAEPDEIVLTHNTTCALVMLSELLRPHRTRVVINAYEHHSNLAPWLDRFDTVVAPTNADGRLVPTALDLRNGDVLAIAHASNVTGVVQPVEAIAEVCAASGAWLVVDGAQSFPHMPIDVRKLGCNFFAFSPHKAFGPTGVGVLWGQRKILTRLKPSWLGGGNVEKLALNGERSLRPVPHRFEPGTPALEAVLGTAEAVRFRARIGPDRIAKASAATQRRLATGLRACTGVQLIGANGDAPRIGIVTLAVPGLDTETLATLLADRYGILARSGFHCAHPLFTGLGIQGGLRLATHTYNTDSECDRVVEVIASLTGGHG